MRVDEKKLRSFLVDGGVLEEKDLTKIEKQAVKNKTSLERELVASKILSEAELKKLEAYILGIPFVNIQKEEIDRDVLVIIPEQIAKSHKIVAFDIDGKVLKVAMVNPDDLQAIDFIKKKTQLEISPCLTTNEGIESALRQYQKSLQTEVSEIIKQSNKISKEEDLQKMAEDIPVIKVLDTLLKHAVLEGASDVHIEPEEENVVIRYRVDGILHDAMVLPKQVLTGLIARIKVLAKLKLDEHRLPQDGRFKINLPECKVSLRVSILSVFDGEKAVLRILNDSSKGLTLESLGVSGDALEIIHRNIKKPNGMMLSTGPTGSGKTTTLYTIMDILNTPQVNISTIEDPVEYRMPRINQTQINSKLGFTFANGLRSLLRQDPDIMMVGEIRDNETAEIAVHAAMTGHLIFSTLHTSSAAGSIPRLVDMGVEPFLIASSLNVVIGQRLVRKLCIECRQKYKLNNSEIESLSGMIDTKKLEKILTKERVLKSGESWKNIEIYKSVGCEKCRDGYHGRCGIFEVMEVSEEIKKLVIEKRAEGEIFSQARKEGMVSIVEDGLLKAAKGITAIEEILRVTK